METITSMTSGAPVRAVSAAPVRCSSVGHVAAALLRTRATSEPSVRCATGGGAYDGTGPSTTQSTTGRTTDTTIQLPTNDVVAFDGVAGIRSWSPPV